MSKIPFRYLPWSRRFANRVDALFGKPTAKHQPGYRKAAEILGVNYQTVMGWKKGHHIPSKGMRLAVGVFMGWISDPKEDHEGIAYTHNYFQNECHSTSKDISEHTLQKAMLKRMRVRKKRRVRYRRKKNETI